MKKEGTTSTTNNNLLLPNRWTGVVMHIIAWSVVVGTPIVIRSSIDAAMTPIGVIRWLIIPLSFAFVFYVNYFLLIGRFLIAKKPWKFLLSNIVLIIVNILVVNFIMDLLPDPSAYEQQGPPPGRPPHSHNWMLEILLPMSVVGLFYTVIVGLSIAIKMTVGWYEVEAMRREWEQKRIEAELQNLKSQLNPHFLFNTLNNIYSLIAFSPEKAQEAVHDLSRLLRYVMYESSSPQVTLEKELDFVHNYVELMRIRLPEHVALQTNITVEKSDALIAPLLFISLIENAFKHGVSNNKPSFISLQIHERENRVICVLSNSYFPKDAERDKSGSGIGIANLQKRLELIYPERHRFQFGQEGNNYFCMLEIQL